MARATSTVGHLLARHQARFHCSKQLTGEVVGVNAMATAPPAFMSRPAPGTGIISGERVTDGALAYLNEAGKTISDEDLVMRPSPSGDWHRHHPSEQWTHYRKVILDYAGIAVFLFGNRRNPGQWGNYLVQRHAGGIRPGVGRGAYHLPVAPRDFMERELWP